MTTLTMRMNIRVQLKREASLRLRTREKMNEQQQPFKTLLEKLEKAEPRLPHRDTVLVSFTVHPSIYLSAF